jgi:hypothetical protein
MLLDTYKKIMRELNIPQMMEFSEEKWNWI